MKSVIVIPARYGSTRFPGKPLALICGQTMLERVYRIACAAIEGLQNTSILIATDDQRIGSHAENIGAKWVLTNPNLATGTDRAFAAATESQLETDFVLNFQGDSPLIPPWVLKALLKCANENPLADIFTPVVQLTWNELDAFRKQKETTPASGTTVVVNQKNEALWFSKQILPFLRNEAQMRAQSLPNEYSPILRHIGIYGYKMSSLKKYISLPPSYYEEIEGLEQLRALEHGLKIEAVRVDYRGRPSMSGVDSPQDITRAEALIQKYGELIP